MNDEKNQSDFASAKKERRKTPRKNLAQAVNAAISTNPVNYDQLRESPRKQPQSELRARILADVDANGVVLDVSQGGLRISSVLQLEPNREIGIFLVLPSKEKGITFICQVRWHMPYVTGMEHWTGLKIIKTSDDQGFTAFIDQLPEMSL